MAPGSAGVVSSSGGTRASASKGSDRREYKRLSIASELGERREVCRVVLVVP